MRTLHILLGGLGADWERTQRDTLFLVLAVTFTLAPHAQHLPYWISAATLALLVYRIWLTVQGRPLPPRWLLLPLALLLCSGLWLEYHTLLGRDAGVALVVILMTLKLLEMHARRDVFVVIYLAFFLILTNFLYSQSMLTAAFMLLALLAILLAQINLHFIHAEPMFGKKLRLASTLLLQALPLMVVMFLLFPRLSGPLWGLPKDAHSGKSGLSDTMAPGSVSSLALSGDLAFRVQFDTLPPTQAQLYWRGPVLDIFDGSTWRAGIAKNATAVQIVTPLQSAPFAYTVTLEAHDKPWIFALEAPLEIPVIAQYPVRLTENMQLLAQQPIRQRIRYRARSQPVFQQLVDLTPAQQHRLVDLPFGYNPRTLALAQQMRQRAHDPAQRLQQALDYFRQQPFRYTLNPPLLGRHAVDEFLFDTQAGFCEHFASSFVVLLRALEIPARVVTGYQGGELNPVDHFMAVRQSDAHAWAEIWIAGQGWLRVDPTALVAPDRIERGIANGLPDNTALPLLMRGNRGWGQDWLKRLHFRWEALNNGWNQWVLSFNQERQRDLLSRLGFADADWRTLSILLLACSSIALGCAAMMLWWRQRQRDPLTLLYARYCACLMTHGITRQPHEGALAFAQRACIQLKPELTDKKPVTRLIQRGALLYTALRYQALEKATYQQHFNSFKTCVNALRHSLKP